MSKLEYYDGSQWAGVGTVSSITAGAGLTGGPITYSGTIALASTAVTAGSYTAANITVDAQGRITSAANGTTPFASLSGTTNQIAVSNSSGAYTISIATNPTIPGNMTINSTGFMTIPVGTTAQRPASPVVGMMRVNSSL